MYNKPGMRKKLIILFFIFIHTLLSANPTLKSRLLKANKGDFVVTAQGSVYSLLMVRDISKQEITLEEIDIEQTNIDLKKIKWQDWVNNKAPGSTSWMTMTIDLENNNIRECFSYTQKQWLFIEKSDYLFANLLSLPLRATKDHERKKIGPAPSPGEIDRRKLWHPQVIRSGKKIKDPHFEVLRTKWPQDKTRLAGCIFELYLDAENPSFPFPYWMEVQHPHFTFKVRTIDSGSGLQSPMPPLKKS